MAEEKKKETLPNIFEKLFACQNELEVITKKKSEQSGGITYAYAKHDDVTNEARKVFKANGILCWVDVTETNFSEVAVKKGNGDEVVETLCDIKINIKFYDVDCPTSFLETNSAGQGIDRGDKAYGKAISYAFKYGLLKCLMAETGLDSDQEQNTEKTGYSKNYKSKTTATESGGNGDFVSPNQRKGHWIETNGRITKLLTVDDYNDNIASLNAEIARQRKADPQSADNLQRNLDARKTALGI